jgi:hypothetical protein
MPTGNWVDSRLPGVSVDFTLGMWLLECMMSELVIRRYQLGDEQGINNLYNVVFGTDRSLAEWHWKYDDSPRGATKLIYVLEDEGRIVGQYANLTLDAVYRGELLFAAQPVDIAIHADYRGRRLIGRLFQTQPALARAEGVRFGFGFPNEAHYRAGKQVLGYRDVGRILLMRRYLNPGLVLGKLTRSRRVLEATRPLGNKLAGLLYRRGLGQPDGERTIEEIARFDERFDFFCERMTHVYPIMVARHRHYLNWRYIDRPDVKYTTYAAMQGAELQGYVVLSMQRRMVLQGLVADLLAVDDATTHLLLRRALTHFLDQGADMVSCWALPHTGLYRTLQHLSFSRRRVAAVLVSMVFDHEMIDEAFLGDPRNWYVAMGDSDGV